MARGVDNNGIGALYGTFDIHITGQAYDLDDEDIGLAVSLTGNNEIGLGADGGSFVGRLEHVNDGIATVQVAGVVRLPVATPNPDPGDGVVVDGNGAVKQAPAVTVDLDGSGVVTLEPAGGDPARGTVLSVNTTAGTADVLLG